LFKPDGFCPIREANIEFEAALSKEESKSNIKLQAASTKEHQTSNPYPSTFWSLEIGASLVFGAWNLVLWAKYPNHPQR
jgi:hypothetical protein